MSEADFQCWVIDLAHRFGWLVHHTRTVNVGGAWRAPLAGDRGLPDLVLARDGVVILAELKTDTGRLGKGQPEWRAALGTHARLWRPRDRAAIVAELGAPRSPVPATPRKVGSEGDRRRHGGTHVTRRYTGFGAGEHGQYNEHGRQGQPRQGAAPARRGSRSGLHGARQY